MSCARLNEGVNGSGSATGERRPGAEAGPGPGTDADGGAEAEVQLEDMDAVAFVAFVSSSVELRTGSGRLAMGRGSSGGTALFVSSAAGVGKGWTWGTDGRR